MQVLVTILIVVSFILIPGCASVPGPLDSELNSQLRNTIQRQLPPPPDEGKMMMAGETLRSDRLIQGFYARHDYRPLWLHNRSPRKQVTTLQRTLAQVENHGLTPDYFHYAAVSYLLSQLNEANQEGITNNLMQLVQLDVLLTDAYLSYTAHMTGAGLDPEIQQSYWQQDRISREDFFKLLDQGLETRKFERFLTSLAPHQESYQQLQASLRLYRQIALAGGWPTIPAGSRLELGVQSPRVALLRERLFITGDLETDSQLNLFDDELDQAVRRFQKRHGLESDGIVMRQTLAALNVPVEERIRQIALNLERRRWLPQSAPSRVVRVNIADYRLEAWEDDKPKLAMNVVVGQAHEDWRTPQISSGITHMILNPLWNVPPGIFAKEMLQEIQEDPEYLNQQNMIVVRIRGEKGEVDPTTIDWTQVDPENPDIRIIQKSGNGNALGQVKFIFPNPYAIYLHDTTAKNLFMRSNRAFSHGCIRVEKPMELAQYLLQESPDWSEESFQASLATESNHKVVLQQPIPVQIFYWTAWSDDDGEVQFRNDIYGYDRELANALKLTPSYVSSF